MRQKNRYFFSSFILTFILFIAIFVGTTVRGQDLNVIGVTLLRAMTTNLDGTGIRLAQAEAELSTNPPTWEVNPANVGRDASLFYYASSAGSSSTYTNSLGTNSWHADHVGNNYYGIPDGVATNAAHIDNFEADYFYNSIVAGSVNIGDPVANQSFIFGTEPLSTQQEIDSAYDNYADNHKTLFVSGAGNGYLSGSVYVTPAGTCYNGICVGVYGGTSSIGPTPDNGRCKPDITAPSISSPGTSFSTPYVSGTAAVLMQAGLRGDGGTDTNSASDIRMVKALLLNGAVKPADWTNATFSPLDLRYGSGMLNAYNSYKQLAGGKHAYIVSTSTSSGGSHPPTGATGTVNSLNAWDFNSVSGNGTTYGVNHYYFNVTNGMSNAVFTATATLVWNRPASPSDTIHYAINNLSLFLYNAANSNLVMVSTSMVDNVQQIFVPHLTPGRYDLQVLNAGGSTIPSTSETYALAWAFTAPKLTVTKSGGNVILSWPAYPAGLEVVSTTDLTSSSWSTSGLPLPSFANGTNSITVPATASAQFFRLYEPNF